MANENDLRYNEHKRQKKTLQGAEGAYLSRKSVKALGSLNHVLVLIGFALCSSAFCEIKVEMPPNVWYTVGGKSKFERGLLNEKAVSLTFGSRHCFLSLKLSGEFGHNQQNRHH